MLCAAKNRQDTLPTRIGKEAQANINENGGISVVRKCLISAGLSNNTTNIIMQSLRNATEKQHRSYFKRWWHFCSRTLTDSNNPSSNEILTFLTALHDEGLGYSAINSAKSMLSVIFEVVHNCDIGQEVLVKCL